MNWGTEQGLTPMSRLPIPLIIRSRVKQVGCFMIKIISLSFMVMLLSACATSQSVVKLSEFIPESNEFVLLSSSPWDTKLRVELAKNNLKVLKFSSQYQVIERGLGSTRVYNESGARYGLTLTWVGIDQCIQNSTRVIDATLEVSDLRTNEVLLVIEDGGFTGRCGFPRKMVFAELAEALANVWFEDVIFTE